MQRNECNIYLQPSTAKHQQRNAAAFDTSETVLQHNCSEMELDGKCFAKIAFKKAPSIVITVIILSDPFVLKFIITQEYSSVVSSLEATLHFLSYYEGFPRELLSFLEFL